MNNDFMNKFMKEFEDQLKKEAQDSLKQYVEKYKEQLDNVEATNDELMKKAINDYHNQRKEHSLQMAKLIEDKLAKAKQDFEAKLAKVDDELFKDPNSLYQKIVAAGDVLKQKQKAFEEEKRKWNKDDKRIAEYLGISYEEKKDSADDEKAADAALKKNEEKISDEDHITIKIDHRTFTPTRGTLTQVKGSFIAKLFGAHHDMMYRDSEGAYYLNCNPDTFAQCLDILRNKGSVGSEFKMTHSLYTMLLQFGILNKFFPNFDASTLGPAVQSKAKHHVVFESYRSTAAWSTCYPRWTKRLLSSDESKDDEKKYWNIDPSNDAQIIFNQTGYYRITFRTCVYYSSHGYAQLQINGSERAICYIYGYGNNNYKSHNLNEIVNISANQKLRFYVSNQPYSEEVSSYLCIEKIPDAILPSIGIWKSTGNSGNYRQWNQAKKTCDRYTLGNSNRNLIIQKGGLYRASIRVHSNSSGQQTMHIYEYRNGGKHNHTTARGTGTSGYQCFMWDEIFTMKKDDYFMVYDSGYSTTNSQNYECCQIENIPLTNTIGVWKSSSVYNTYQRKWDYEYWSNDMLYVLDNNKSQIEFKEPGNYRISSHVTQSTGSSTAGHSALYLNNSQYALARYAAHGSTYQHTTIIQEILKIKKGDKIYIYSSAPYNNKDYNSLFIEKLC